MNAPAARARPHGPPRATLAGGRWPSSRSSSRSSWRVARGCRAAGRRAARRGGRRPGRPAWSARCTTRRPPCWPRPRCRSCSDGSCAWRWWARRVLALWWLLTHGRRPHGLPRTGRAAPGPRGVGGRRRRVVAVPQRACSSAGASRWRWYALDRFVPGPGPSADVAGWWRTEPWSVAAVAAAGPGRGAAAMTAIADAQPGDPRPTPRAPPWSAPSPWSRRAGCCAARCSGSALALTVWAMWSAVPDPDEWSGATVRGDRGLRRRPSCSPSPSVVAVSFHRERTSGRPLRPRRARRERSVARLVAAAPARRPGRSASRRSLAWRQRDIGGLTSASSPAGPLTPSSPRASWRSRSPSPCWRSRWAPPSGRRMRAPRRGGPAAVRAVARHERLLALRGSPGHALLDRPGPAGERSRRARPPPTRCPSPPTGCSRHPHEFSDQWTRVLRLRADWPWWHAVWLLGLALPLARRGVPAQAGAPAAARPRGVLGRARRRRPVRGAAVRPLRRLALALLPHVARGVCAGGVRQRRRGPRRRHRWHRPREGTRRVPVVIDSDLAPDDLAAIAYLVRHPAVEVLAITVPTTGMVTCRGRGAARRLLRRHRAEPGAASPAAATPRGEHGVPFPRRLDQRVAQLERASTARAAEAATRRARGRRDVPGPAGRPRRRPARRRPGPADGDRGDAARATPRRTHGSPASPRWPASSTPSRTTPSLGVGEWNAAADVDAFAAVLAGTVPLTVVPDDPVPDGRPAGLAAPVVSRLGNDPAFSTRRSGTSPPPARSRPRLR